MNIEELKDCFGSITPTKEQKEKMLTAVMNAKEQPVKVVKLNRYKYMSAVAAVVAVGVFAAVYSNMGNDVVEPDISVQEYAIEERTVEKVKDTQEVVEPNSSVVIEDTEEEKVVQNSTVTENKKSTDKVDKKDNSKSTELTDKLKENYPELTDTQKTETTKTAIKDNSINTEIPKTETTKAEIPKTETPKAEAPKTETPKNETIKTEDKKIDESKVNVVSEDEILEDKTREMPAPTATNDENQIENDVDSEIPQDSVDNNQRASGGGGGGSAGGGSASLNCKSLTLSQITSDSVYSTLFPATFVDGFTFTEAYETEKIMEAHFETTDGRYMSVSVVENGKYNVYQQIVTPSQIADMTADGYMEFAVKCGNYYVIYYVETDSASEVYEMVTSSEYFK